jgi:16S rRNA (cytosine1402-N4)-methyltransferase
MSETSSPALRIPHTPVLLKEVVVYVNAKADGLYLDATFGAGGYSAAILKEGARVIAIDRDPSTKQFADILKEQFGELFAYHNTDFANLSSVEGYLEEGLDGAVYDLGMSSMQIDSNGRGFSFMRDEALDMRMDQREELNAYDVVNTYPEDQLADIIYIYGDERRSRAIAKAIVERRQMSPIATTAELRELIINRVGKSYKDNIDPSTRTFQAIRIEVNDELAQISQSLLEVSRHIKIGGRIVVVSFHSGEDRIVKNIFNELCDKGNKEYDPIFGTVVGDKKTGPLYKKVNNKVITPSKSEIEQNIRSRSAKLRVIERIA